MATAMLAALPQMNSKISVMFGMGPNIFMQYMEAEFLKRWAFSGGADVSANIAATRMILSPATHAGSHAWTCSTQHHVTDPTHTLCNSGTSQTLPLTAVGEFLFPRLVSQFVTQCVDNYWSEYCVNQLTTVFYGPSIFTPPDDYLVIGQTWPCAVTSRNVLHLVQVGYTVPRHPFSLRL